LCALAAAEHEQARPAFAACVAALGRCNRDDLCTHRVPDTLGLYRTAKAAGKSLEHARRQARQHAIGQAGDRILFVHDERTAQQPRGTPPGPTRIRRRRARRGWCLRTAPIAWISQCSRNGAPTA
jgi:hypothetical protein